jgi:DNA polymerase-3 subunit epsilon
MTLHLKNPIAFFDLETTGTIVSRDRIVEIAILRINPDGEKKIKTQLINPEIPIPEEARLIHGISDEDVKDAPVFKSVARELMQFLEGCDLSGFNIIKFDVPLLVEEFLRAEINFDVSKRKLIDSQKIFHLMEKRTLSAAYKFYCQKDLVKAHSAEADTVASYEILEKQVALYDGQEVLDLKGNKLGTIENNMEQLHGITVSNMVDLAGRMVYNDQGVEVFNFGKHRHRPVTEVLEREPTYYDWMIKGDFPLDTKRRLTEIKLRQFNKR